jgi:hypothetical protein
MNDEEDFDGSALRELLTPVVAARGRGAAPADAIVAAGRRRVVGRRVAAVGGALAVVAAVPLAATAFATGAGKAGTTAANVPPTATGTLAHAARTPGLGGPVTSATPPSRSSTPSPTGVGTKPSPPPSTWGLPDTAAFLTSGVIEGRPWSVSGVGRTLRDAPGDPTQPKACLDLIISQSGQAMDPTQPAREAYCVPELGPQYAVWQFGAGINGGVGMLAVGSAPSKVTRVVVHATGVPDPITVQTVPAPGLPGRVLYLVPVPREDTVHATFDGYDAQGKLVGSFNTWGNSAMSFGD